MCTNLKKLIVMFLSFYIRYGATFKRKIEIKDIEESNILALLTDCHLLFTCGYPQVLVRIYANCHSLVTGSSTPLANQDGAL